MSADPASRLAREILAYLSDHPDARDTVEGIATWWVASRGVEADSPAVRVALADLVIRGFVVESRRRNSRIHYRVNRSRLEEIRDLLGRSLET